MNHLRIFSRAVAGALIINALAHLLGGVGGEFLAFPGRMIAMFFEVAIMMLSDSEAYYPLLNIAPLFSFIFYSVSIHLFLWLYAVIKRDNELHRESLRQYRSRHTNG